MALKTAEERIDSLERTTRIYRILVVLLFLLILALERQHVVSWLDSVEGWFGNTFNAAMAPSQDAEGHLSPTGMLERRRHA